MKHIPNILSIFRLILGPLFFIIFLYGLHNSTMRPLLFIILCSIFMCIEISDFLDGFIARRYNLITNLGKILDPFSDVISRVTYFITFMIIDIIPPYFLLIIFYREFYVIFFRMLLIQKNIFFHARFIGKLKALCYLFVCLWSLCILYSQWIQPISWISTIQLMSVMNILIMTTIAVVFISFFSYLKVMITALRT